MMKNYLFAGVCIAALAATVTLSVSLLSPQRAEAHCQVPCGIYDDHARIAAMREDVATIRKAVDQIGQLAGKHDALAANQAVRWINTKEEHASHIIETVALYFLTQKVADVPAGADGHAAYLKSLAEHHAVMRAAMKTKQTVDPGAVHALADAIDSLAARYPHQH